MKKVILIRHASAVPHGSAKSDFRRSLRKKGRRETIAMAGWYRDAVGEKPGLILSSSANRAIETARLFAEQIKYPLKKIKQSRALYDLYEPSDFLDIIKTLDDKYTSVMVYGHDPVFTGFAQYLVKDFREYLPKCSVVVISLRRSFWRNIKPGDGRLLAYEHPAGLQEKTEQVKEIRKELSARIEQGIKKALADFGLGEEPAGKNIRRASKRLAKAYAPRIQKGASKAFSTQATRRSSAKEKTT